MGTVHGGRVVARALCAEGVSHVRMFGADGVVATRLDLTRYDCVAEALGCHGEYVERREKIRPAMERAPAAGRPAVVNIKIGQSDFRKGSIAF